MKKYLLPANILLPDFNKTDAGKWAVIACDQFTSEEKYCIRWHMGFTEPKELFSNRKRKIHSNGLFYSRFSKQKNSTI